MVKYCLANLSIEKKYTKKTVNFSIYDSKIFKAYELFLSLKFVIITKKIRLFEAITVRKRIFNTQMRKQY